MKKLIFALLVAGCGGDGPMETCTANACPNGKLYQQCATGATQLRYVLGSTVCTCGATSCGDCAVLLANYCSNDSSNGTTNGGTNGTNGGTSGSTTGTNGGTNGGTTGGACKAGGIACQSFDECCSGTCANQVCTQCRDNGSPCTLASQCCSNICHVGSCAACGDPGTTCSDSHECCNGVACVNGICGGPDFQCAAQGALDCIACCQQRHSSGANDYNSLATSCLCQASTCLSSCGLQACPSPAPAGDPNACDSCFVSTCEAPTDAACMNNATCKPYVVCVDACPTM